MRGSILWHWLLLLASIVVAWKAERGDFVGMDRFPPVFAVAIAFAALVPLLGVRSAPRLPRLLLALSAIALASWGAVAHHRVLESRIAEATVYAEERWLGRAIERVDYHRAWSLPGGGGRVDLSEGTVLLNFWGTWCTPCVAEMPELDAAWERHRERGVRILGLTTDFSNGGPSGLATAEREIGEFLERVPVSYPILLLSTEAFVEFGIENYPTTLWLEDGVVRSVSVGIDGTRTFLERLDA